MVENAGCWIRDMRCRIRGQYKMQNRWKMWLGGKCGADGGKCGVYGGKCRVDGGKCGVYDGKCGIEGGKCGVEGGKSCPHTENRMLCEKGECLVRNLPTFENFEVCNLRWVLFIIFKGEKVI